MIMNFFLFVIAVFVLLVCFYVLSTIQAYAWFTVINIMMEDENEKK